jgi:ABC-type branched-subunit amino acid transport system permease subunit
LEGVPVVLELHRSLLVRGALVVLVPGLLAFVFGFFAFRSRIKGVYFRSSRRR